MREGDKHCVKKIQVVREAVKLCPFFLKSFRSISFTVTVSSFASVFIHPPHLHHIKSQSSTKPTSAPKRPSVVAKGNTAAADLGDGLSSIRAKAGGAGPGQPAVSSRLDEWRAELNLLTAAGVIAHQTTKIVTRRATAWELTKPPPFTRDASAEQ